MAIDFLIDENMPHAVFRAILRHNRRSVHPIDAVHIGGAYAPPKGCANPFGRV